MKFWKESLTDAYGLLAGWAYGHFGESVDMSFATSAYFIELGALVSEIDQSDGYSIELIMRLTNCIADGGRDFNDRLLAFVNSYVPPDQVG